MCPRIRKGSCALFALVFLLCTAFAPVHGVTRQQDSANDAHIKPCCSPGIASARADDQDNPAVTDTNITGLPDSVSPPFDISRVLDRTLEDILGEAERTLGRFNTLRLGSDLFLGLDAGVDDRVIHRLGMLVSKLSQLISGLREVADATLPELLSNQAENLRRDAVRLFIATHRLDLLMQARDRCGLHNLGVFLSAVETLALELATWQTGTATPTLHYFFFEGQLPNVVPPDGGWLVLASSGLWQEGGPHVTLIDPERETIVAVPEVRQTGGNATAAVKIEPDWITANAGRCLSLRAGSNSVNGMHWWKQPEPAAYSELPVCIPQSFDTQYRIAGFLEYQTPTQTRRLTSKAILFENASCEDRKQVSESLQWTLDQGGWLIDMDESPLYEAGVSSIDCTLAEDSIICSGYLEKAVCSQTLQSGNTGDEPDLLLEQTEWEHIFTPIAEYPLEEKHRSWALSQSVDPGLPVTEVAVTIPREESSEQTTIWYELIVVNGGLQKTVFTSPRNALPGMEQYSYTTAHDRMTVDLDPAADSTDAKIRISIDPATCPY